MNNARHADMSVSGFEQGHLYACLRALEWRAARDAQNSWPAGAADDHWPAGLAGWAAGRHHGERVRRLRAAIAQSEGIALRSLRLALDGIELRAIWPPMREACHDAALRLGCAAVVDIPGAGILPGLFGLRLVAQYMAGRAPRAADAYRRGFRDAWGTLAEDGRAGGRPSPADAQFCDSGTWAAHDFALGHQIIVTALLTAMVAYLGSDAGGLPLLAGEIRRGARAGPGIADWVVRNERALRDHRALQGSGSAPPR